MEHLHRFHACFSPPRGEAAASAVKHVSEVLLSCRLESNAKTVLMFFFFLHYVQFSWLQWGKTKQDKHLQYYYHIKMTRQCDLDKPPWLTVRLYLCLCYTANLCERRQASKCNHRQLYSLLSLCPAWLCVCVSMCVRICLTLVAIMRTHADRLSPLTALDCQSQIRQANKKREK